MCIRDSTSTYSSPDGIDLSDSPLLRSLYQQAIGNTNLEAKLNKLSTDPKILVSIQQMHNDRNSGKREMDPMAAYVHNRIINSIFVDARKKAWAQIRNHPEARRLYAEDKRINIQNIQSLTKTSNFLEPKGDLNNVLRLYK